MRQHQGGELLTEIERLAEDIVRASKPTDDTAHLAGAILDLIRGETG